jgi:hypothetical protein
MFEHKVVFEALGKLDTNACEKVLGPNGLGDPEIARRFLLVIRQSGCLLMKFANALREAKRDNFVAWLKAELPGKVDAETNAAFEAHFSDATLIERAFRQISLSMEQSEIWQLDAAIQAWGILQRGFAEARDLNEKMLQVIKNHIPSSDQVFDPTQVRLEAGNGVSVEPTQVQEGIIQSVATTLFLLAHKNGWFDQHTNELVLPIEVTADDQTVFRSGTHTLLSLRWLHLEKAWDRARYFETHVRVEGFELPSENGGTRTAEALTSEDPVQMEVLDHIATNRLERIVYEQTAGSLRQGINQFAEITKDVVIPLPPEGFFSVSEDIATSVLMDVYCVPVDDETQLFAGLPLKVWIRGYAYYEYLAKGCDGEPSLECVILRYEQLANDLAAVGISPDHAARFIELTTFRKYARDLYDTPLIRVKDGTFRFFSPAFLSPQLAAIVLSRIGSMNRMLRSDDAQAEVIQFVDKGRKFEGRILDLFVKAGIPARAFKYKIAGVEYDCDAAALLGDTVFVFECKNYNLPLGRISELSHFTNSLADFKTQVSRIAAQLNQHREILLEQFGHDVKWREIVPCVLQALPWSMGRWGDVYFYDQSSLTRFIREGAILVHNMVSDRNEQLTSRHSIKLRASKMPTDKELLKELDNPVQLRAHMNGWELERTAIPIGKGKFLALPEWSQRALSFEEQLKGLGFDSRQAGEIIHELTASPALGAKPSIAKAFRSLSVTKQGRNEKCLCGSGDKFKKCCGKKFGN